MATGNEISGNICCKSLKFEIEQTQTIYILSGVGWVMKSKHDLTPIFYCPFCGKPLK